MGEPVDLYIERTNYEEFSLLTLFPPFKPWVLENLETQGATISFGAEEHAVNHRYFSTSSFLYFYYEPDDPSFGLGIELHGATWPCNTPLPNIEHTLNGCMLFETLGKGNLAERLNATKLDSYKSNSYILVYSTIDGMNTTLIIEGISTRFQVMGSITGSEENDGNELRVATFAATAHENLKVIFP